MKIAIVPLGKPRQTRADKWKQRPAVMRYRAFADELRLKYRQPLPERVKLVFYLPMPQSWSNKKRAAMNGQPHQQKPDIDNLAKSVFDALCIDDSNIYSCELSKYWGEAGAIEIDEKEG